MSRERSPRLEVNMYTPSKQSSNHSNTALETWHKLWSSMGSSSQQVRKWSHQVTLLTVTSITCTLRPVMLSICSIRSRGRRISIWRDPTRLWVVNSRVQSSRMHLILMVSVWVRRAEALGQDNLNTWSRTAHKQTISWRIKYHRGGQAKLIRSSHPGYLSLQRVGPTQRCIEEMSREVRMQDLLRADSALQRPRNNRWLSGPHKHGKNRITPSRE